MRKLLVYLLCFSFMIPLSTFAVNSADDANYEEKYITIKRVNDDQEDVYKVITDGEKVYLSVTDLLEIANFEDKVFDVNAETHALNKVILTKKKDHHGFNQDIVINANDKTISSDLYGQSEFDGYIDLKDDVYLEIIDIFNYLRIKAAVLDEKLYVNIPVYTFLDFLVEDYQSALMNTVSQLDLLEYGESSNHSGLIDALALACKNFDIKLLIPWWGANELKDEQYKKAIMTLKEEDSVFYDEDTKQYMKEELEKRGFEGVLASGEDLVNLMSIGGNTLETVEDVFEELANASEIDRKTYESFMEVVNWDGEIFHGASQLKAWSKQAEGISDVISIADVVISAYETYSRANSWNDERLKDLEILSSLNEENYADHKDYIERIKKVADECYQESEKNGDAVRDQIAKDTVSLLAEKAITETSVYGKVADLFVLAINTGVSVARCFGNVAENMDKAELSYMVTCLINIAVASRIDAEIKYDKLDLKQLHTSKDLDDFRNSMVTYLKSNLRCWSYIYYLNSDGKWENSLSGKEVKSKIDKMNTYLTLIDESAQYDYALDEYDVNTYTSGQIIDVLEEKIGGENAHELKEPIDMEDKVQMINANDLLSFSGILTSEYYEINSNNKGNVAILDLDSPFKCYVYDEWMSNNGWSSYDGKTEFYIDSVQINGLSNPQNYYGKNITVSGSVCLAHNGHHRRTIMLQDSIVKEKEDVDVLDGKWTNESGLSIEFDDGIFAIFGETGVKESTGVYNIDEDGTLIMESGDNKQKYRYMTLDELERGVQYNKETINSRWYDGWCLEGDAFYWYRAEPFYKTIE
ncbi:MAG: DUF4431 domain-containing protein [Acutalibacteraceae bacterium]